MKFKIKRQHLMNSIQNVTKAISSKTVIPILTGMKIAVKKNGIILTGSDSNISIESYIPIQLNDEIIIEQIEEGTIVLPVPHFPEIIRKLPEETVEITVDDQYITTITSGKAVFTLNGQSSAEYPQFPAFQKDNSIRIQTNILKTLIKQTEFAVSTMETRPILTGVNIRINNDKIIFTATDSHRLAAREVNLNHPEPIEKNIVIPGKSLNELNKIIDDTDEEINISIMDNQILFYTKYISFLSRLLNGNYPETDQLIPETSQTTIQVNTKDLIHTIERAALLASADENNVVRLETLDKQALEISSQSPEVGTVVEEINVTSIEGEEIKISFSSKYMLEALKIIENDEIMINFTGPMRPFIIRPVADDSLLQLILPVRTF